MSVHFHRSGLINLQLLCLYWICYIKKKKQFGTSSYHIPVAVWQWCSYFHKLSYLMTTNQLPLIQVRSTVMFHHTSNARFIFIFDQ